MTLFHQVQGVARVALVEHDFAPLEASATHLGQQPGPGVGGQGLEQLRSGRHRGETVVP